MRRKKNASTKIEEIGRALQVALDVHQGINRVDGRPYVDHVLRVAASVAESWPGDSDAFIAALLHDVVEEGNLTIEDMRFSRRVKGAVKALSRRRGGERYSEYILRCASNRTAARVKFCDLRDNMRGATPSLMHRYEKSLPVIVDALLDANSLPEGAEL